MSVVLEKVRMEQLWCLLYQRRYGVDNYGVCCIREGIEWTIMVSVVSEKVWSEQSVSCIREGME